MAEVNFIIRSENATARVDETKVKALESRFCKVIKIPLSIHFKKITKHHNYQLELNARWLSIKGSIEIAGSGQIVTFFSEIVNREIFPGHQILAELNIEFSQSKIDLIESYRQGDLNLILNGVVFIDVQEDTNEFVTEALSDGVKRGLTSPPNIFRLEEHHFSLPMKLAKSQWVEEILSVIYRPFRLVQVPQLTGKFSKSIIAELNKAEQYYLSGDYDKVVAHCRSALEGIRRKFPHLREQSKSFNGMEKWKAGVSTSTYEWLDKMLKVQADITNLTHHADPISFDHFLREDAEAIFLVTVAVIRLGTRLPEIGKD